MSSVAAFKIAASSAETSGTWTNAELLACAVYTDSVNYLIPFASNGSAATSTSLGYQSLIAYPSTSVSSIGVSAWVVGCGLSALNSTATETAPASMTNRVSQAGATDGEIAIHDTNADVASWSTTSVTITSSVWHALTLSLLDTGIAKASGGGMIGGGNLSGGFQ